MIKILVALDCRVINLRTIDFACFMARLTHSKLIGIFLEEREFEKTPTRKIVLGQPYIETIVASDIPGNEARQKTMLENIHVFKDACENRGIPTGSRVADGIPATEIVRETRFADVLIVDATTSFSNKPEASPTDFVKEILTRSECPVIIAPESDGIIGEIIFPCDYSRSAATAIKHFSYLFPEFGNKKLTVLEVKKEETKPDADVGRLNEWLAVHYQNAVYVSLKGDPTDEIFAYLLKRDNIMAVMGSYGRSSLSRLFRPSHAELVTKTMTRPLFISHD
jgi:nucleotide-binding universal stress UspA family protein